MKNFFKKNKKIIILVISLIIIGISAFILFIIFNNENVLTVDERSWVDDNSNSVLNVNIINDVDVFGINGEGVFFDFVDSFSTEYALTINPITFNYTEEMSGLTLGVKDNIDSDDLVFYEDHYVLVGKDYENVIDYNYLNEKEVGIIDTDNNKLNNLSDYGLEFVEYETEKELLEAFSEELEYIIVPLNIYLSEILSNNYEVLYHFSDINYYFVLENDGSVLFNVMKKFYNRTWNEELYYSYKTNEFAAYTTSLNITETEIHELRSVEYTYGMIDNYPYEIIAAGEFGGISAVSVKEFSDFSGVEFNFEKYKNIKELNSAIEKKEIDVYLDNYNFTSNYKNLNSGLSQEYEIIVNKSNSMVIDSLNALEGKDIYVKENSKLYDYVNSIKNINVLTYELSELNKLNKNDSIILIDKNEYEVYSKDQLDEYTSRYSGLLSYDVVYSVSDSEPVLYLLFNKYASLLSDKISINEGINNYYETAAAGNIINLISRYIIILVIVATIILYLVIRKSKKIKIAKKIKKDDKMKFIDQLTSLKNRNYLNECINSWDNNTIYPQAIILTNLNSIQKLNDQHGYNEGDRQIKSFANALIKTQLDNSEIMRTDGNEFVIYLIGYSQKQITNYIHKLNKEVEKLPYDNGAKFGYSMILDNLKSIEDCLNEASSDMKEKKNNEKGK